MLFNSLSFLVFFALVLIYWNLPVSWTHRKRMLLLASYIFYGLWNPPLVILLWISTVVDWVAGNRLHRETDPRKRRMWLMLSILVNMGFLVFFKYGGFLLENFQVMAGWVGLSFTPLEWDIILPMGISFYTFQTMSYSIDMYYRKIDPAPRFLDFALYVTFFPQLVAGPIVRSEELVPQFSAPRRATQQQLLWGTFLLTLGLFEKVVMADVLLADHADTVFGSGKVLHTLDAWTGTLAFSGQIFFDFAGYSTCAIGIALMLGFTLPDNFRYPYASIGFSELWQRWHISLSSWLRDYLYIPMGGNRLGNGRTMVNLMMTMLLGGLWHGAGWTFLFWGFLHGTYLVLERLIKRRVRMTINAWNGILLALGTYTLVNITWVFFRAGTFGKASDILASMFFLHPEGDKVLDTHEIIQVFTVTTLLFLSHWFMRNTSVKAVAEKTHWSILGGIWAVMLTLLCMAQGSGEQFIYFQF
ncbi:MAG: MBOAT family protein [Lewinellaceae bacterium]|nr:MBOAT family protein [Saprospiraceae bacterium]MCB9311911.1 MBOAT family protein [Lewinellaceae bacterium]HRW74483.1 MBOAT family O-acyltransferase [Saprospiraceae bacterium]